MRGLLTPVPGITTVVGEGESQGGLYLRDFLYQGFNEDEAGQRVFDGVNVLLKDRAGTLIPSGTNSLGTNYVTSFFDPNVYRNVLDMLQNRIWVAAGFSA